MPFITQSFTVQTAIVTVNSFNLTDSAAARTWYGPFNGAPISIAIGNTFQITGGSGVAGAYRFLLLKGVSARYRGDRMTPDLGRRDPLVLVLAAAGIQISLT